MWKREEVEKTKIEEEKYLAVKGNTKAKNRREKRFEDKRGCGKRKRWKS